ncbi:AraC family transcriptional regulator [soil metagenome]
MHFLEAQTSWPSEAGSIPASQGRPGAPIIEDEVNWRFPSGRPSRPVEGRTRVTRWRALADVRSEARAEASDQHVIAIALRNQNVRFSVAGRTVHDGPVAPGMLHVSPPGAEASCVFRGPYDVLHLHVPDELISKLRQDAAGHGALACWSTLRCEPTVLALARPLLDAENIGGSFGRLYADHVALAVVAVILGSAHALKPPATAGLSTWRMKRALDYIEANLAGAVTLADIASAAGLTRMYFAAQFRTRTGLRPHEYLLRRRIERAQQLLVRPGASVVDAALAVGFHSQSHFTTVFKRYVGQTPRAWCRSQVPTGEGRRPAR